MAAKQTRRSVTIKTETYDRLKAFCETHECSLAGVTETVLRRALGLPDNTKIDSHIRDTVSKATEL